MRLSNINANLIRVVENFYKKSTSAVYAEKLLVFLRIAHKTAVCNLSAFMFLTTLFTKRMDMAFLKMDGFVKFYYEALQHCSQPDPSHWELLQVTSAVYVNRGIIKNDGRRQTHKAVCSHRLSLTCFCMKRIMNDALEDHKGTVSIGDRTITEQLPMTLMTWQETRRK